MSTSDPNLQVHAAEGRHTHVTTPRSAHEPPRAEAVQTESHATASAPPDLRKIADSMRQLSVDLPWSMQLSFDADVKDSVIVVRNQATGEVVRQIPSEQAVALQRFVEGGNPKGEPPLGLLLDTLT